MTDVFLYTDYKAFLRAVLANTERKKTVSQLAEAAQCQRSYLSKVMSSEVHLTPDHAFGISEFLSLSPKSHRYFMGLVNLARAGHKKFRDHLSAEVKAMRKEHLDIANKVQANIVHHGENHQLYYSSWLWVAAHIGTSVPAYQDPNRLARKLRLSPEELEKVLSMLEELGYVKKSGRSWMMTDTEIHLHKTSPLISVHHQNWRQKAILSSQLRPEDNIHYTTVSSISVRDRERLKNEFLGFIEKMRSMISASPEEELVCVNIDCFDV